MEETPINLENMEISEGVNIAFKIVAASDGYSDLILTVFQLYTWS
jgi:hypothetical protein